MSDRRLVAVLACRLTGSRLYAKPLQPLALGVSILAQTVAALQSEPFVDEVALAIADEPESRWMVELAARLGCAAVLGDGEDVLARLILAAEATGATDVLRKTSECPFHEIDACAEAWRRHVGDINDVTVVDDVPLGTSVEFYRLEALQRSHAEGQDGDRSELVSNYVRFNQARFRLGIVEPAPALRRPDLRLTVDYAEDLIVCQAVYRELAAQAPRIAMADAVAFLDRRPDLRALVAPFIAPDPAPFWRGAPQRD